MSGAVRADPPSWRTAVDLAVALLPIGLLASLAAPGALAGLLVTAVAGAAAAILAFARRTRDSDWRAVPLLAAVGYGAVFAPPSFLTGALAGAATLATVYAASRDRASVARPRDAVVALLLPAVALVLALFSASLLPAPTAAVGVAAVIVVGVLLLVAWLYRSDAVGVPEPPSAY